MKNRRPAAASLTLEFVCNTDNPIPHDGHIEIQYQTQPQFREFQVGQNLREVDRFNLDT